MSSDINKAPSPLAGEDRGEGAQVPTSHAPLPIPPDKPTSPIADNVTPEGMPELISQLRGLIESARGQALRAVDFIQVRTCWEIGRHVVEFEQQGQDRATYGARLIPKLAKSLTAEFGKGFDERNLRHMRAFFQGFPIWNAVRTELSWTHYRNLLRVGDEQARNWYMDEAANQNWSTRALDRQIGITCMLEEVLVSGQWTARNRRSMCKVPGSVIYRCFATLH